MSEKPEIAALSADVNARFFGLAAGKFAATSLRFSMDVNTFPSVSANIAKPKGDVSVHAPVSAEVIQRIGQLQKQRLAGRTETDFNVTATDGRGGEIEYEGFIAAPILELTKVTTIDKISSVGKVALIDALNLSIYASGYSLEREEAGSDLKPIKAARSGKVTEVMADITDTLVDNYDAAFDAEHLQVAKEMMQLQHEINTSGPLELWKEILDNSDVKYDSWEAAFKVSPAIAIALSERTKDFLEAQNSGFWDQIQSMMSSFQMYYVPEFNGVGRFERLDKKMAKPEVKINASVSGLSVADGSSRILQPGGVVMMMRAAATERQESQPDPNVPRVAAYAPDPLLPGFIHREPPPFWLTREEGVPIFGSEITDDDRNIVTRTLDMAKREAAKLVFWDYKAKVNTASEGVMSELCGVIFKELQLAQSTAVLTLPLDFKMNEYVGKRAKIHINSGGGYLSDNGPTFTAFVSGITHSIDLQQGKQLNSSTELRLSHADYR